MDTEKMCAVWSLMGVLNPAECSWLFVQWLCSMESVLSCDGVGGVIGKVLQVMEVFLESNYELGRIDVEEYSRKMNEVRDMLEWLSN